MPGAKIDCGEKPLMLTSDEPVNACPINLVKEVFDRPAVFETLVELNPPSPKVNYEDNNDNTLTEEHIRQHSS
jgi:hypothetical protein